MIRFVLRLKGGCFGLGGLSNMNIHVFGAHPHLLSHFSSPNLLPLTPPNPLHILPKGRYVSSTYHIPFFYTYNMYILHTHTGAHM